MVTNFIYNPNGDRVFEWVPSISGSASSAVGFVPTTFAGVTTDQYFKLVISPIAMAKSMREQANSRDSVDVSQFHVSIRHHWKLQLLSEAD